MERRDRDGRDGICRQALRCQGARHADRALTPYPQDCAGQPFSYVKFRDFVELLEKVNFEVLDGKQGQALLNTNGGSGHADKTMFAFLTPKAGGAEDVG